jgi:tryptophanyl-tRNA synthetase
MLKEFEDDYKDGISWGDAKNKLFNIVNDEMLPIREKYESLINDKNLLNDLLSEGSNKVRPIAQEMLSGIRDSIGIKKIF